jgi:hypothetical protein
MDDEDEVTAEEEGEAPDVVQYPWLLLGEGNAHVRDEWRRTFIFERMAHKDWEGDALVKSMAAIDAWLEGRPQLTTATSATCVIAFRKS